MVPSNCPDCGAPLAGSEACESCALINEGLSRTAAVQNQSRKTSDANATLGCAMLLLTLAFGVALGIILGITLF